MSPKQLEPGSDYARFDTDKDGTVSDLEISAGERLDALQLTYDKEQSKTRMAWVALLTIVGFSLLPIMPFVPESRLSTLASLSDLLFLSMAGIVGAHFGTQLIASRKK